ncbi:MAG TPA: hypothetical protein VF546_24140 [Pyrinomonadaceae bacterium]|jgi:hypothetical protein
MITYRLRDGDTFVFSVNGGAWEAVTFDAKDFKDPAAATAEELASVINRSGSLAASADAEGTLVLATASAGGHTSLEVDVEASSAAAALGLGLGRAAAQGEGVRAARVVSRAAEPFPLPLGSEMSVNVDDQRRKVSFDDSITPGAATAAEVCKVINMKRKKVADVTRDGRVAITSLTVGLKSKVEIEPGAQGKTDAAAILGFVGAAAFDQPYRAEPARLACRGAQAGGLEVQNLTASPIEIHLASGTTVLPARGTVPLAAGDAGNSQLQRFIAQGAVRLAAKSEQ